MKELGNFHGFFPQGYLRQEFYRKNDPLIERIILDVDGLIIKTKFDLESYLKIVEVNLKATRAISKLFGEPHAEKEKILQPHLDQMESSAKTRNEMIYPIYEILISRDYTEKQLRQ